MALDFTRAGGLINYGTDLRDNYYRLAYFIDELLKGTKPGNLPSNKSWSSARHQSEDCQDTRDYRSAIGPSTCG